MAGGVRNEPVGGRGVVISSEKEKKKEQNELTMSSRTRSVTHLAGPPTSRVLPLNVAPPAEKGGPTSLGRGEGLTAAVPGRRERGEEGGGEGNQENAHAGGRTSKHGSCDLLNSQSQYRIQRCTNCAGTAGPLNTR